MTLRNFTAFLDALEDFSSYYTRDSYRAPVLNSLDRCIEIQRVAIEVQDGRLREGVVSWMIEELKASVVNDKVLKLYFRKQTQDFCELIVDSQIEMRIFAVDRLCSEIESSYFKKCRKAIKTCVLANDIPPNKLEELAHFCGIFYSLLINVGHTQEEVFRQVSAAKRRPVSHRSVQRELDEFYKLFPCKVKQYNAYVSASKHLMAAMTDATVEDITGVVPRPIYIRHKAELNPQMPDRSVFRVLGVEAFDLADARQRVETKLKLARAISYTQRHDMDASWEEKMVVEDLDNGTSVAIVSPLSPMQSRRRISRAHSEKVVSDRSQKISDNSNGAELRALLENSIMEYANAFHSDSPTTQLVSVWSALEGLSPRIPVKEGGRVAEVSDVVCTAQELYYPRNLMQWNFTNHFSIDGEKFKQIIDQRAASKDRLKNFSAIILRCDDKVASDGLKSLASDKPMIQFRCFQAITKMSSGVKVLKSISDHSRRVDWQVRRIYLERNRIVHRASPSKNVSALLLNLCEYYLNTLELFFEFIEHHPKKNSAKYCYFEAKQRLKSRNAIIKNWKNPKDIDLDLLLGY